MELTLQRARFQDACLGRFHRKPLQQCPIGTRAIVAVAVLPAPLAQPRVPASCDVDAAFDVLHVRA